VSFESIKTYQYNGARSLVLLHDKNMKLFVQTWYEAKKLSIKLPETDDEDYQSMETLLRHVLRSARGYMTWMCEQLNLPDPEIEMVPELAIIEKKVDEYLSHLLESWQLPLAEIPIERFSSSTYTASWGTDYCIDAMLEHAVMHPIRHEFQLRNLINNSAD
jgi:uncharacterized damage-inducible protein DinB